MLQVGATGIEGWMDGCVGWWVGGGMDGSYGNKVGDCGLHSLDSGQGLKISCFFYSGS
jgi:hypothetical protein